MSSADLQHLLDIARDEGGAGSLEDWVPVDLGLDVSIPVAHEMLRVDPGTESAPISDIARARLVCTATDDFGRTSLGFAVSDLLEVSFRAQDEALRAISPAWRDQRITSPGSEICIDDDELEAGAKIDSDLRSVAGRCSNPTSALAAVDWASIAVEDLTVDLGSTIAWFGPILGVREGPAIRALPSGFQLEGLMASIASLAGLAKQRQPITSKRFDLACAEEVAGLLSRHNRLLPVPRTPQGLIHSICPVTSVDYIAVELLSDLDSVSQARLDRAAKRLESVAAGHSYTNGHIEVTLPSDAEIVPLVVVATPIHAVANVMPTEVIVTLDDLRRIASTATNDDDLYWFCRDLMDLASRTRLLGFEIANYWGWWLANGKSFHHGADLPNLIVFDPHVVGDEWADAAKVTDLERALLGVGLPDSAEWEYRNIDPMRTVVRNDESGEVWVVAWAPATYGIRSIDSGTPRGLMSLIGNFAEAATWMIARAGDAVLNAAPDSFRIHLDFREDGPPLGDCRLVGDATVAISWNAGLAGVPSMEIHELMAATLADAMVLISPATAVDGMRGALAATPVAFSIDQQDVRQVTVNLPQPLAPHPTQRAYLQRELAEALRDRSVTPGRYEGEDAVRLESETTFPLLYEALVMGLGRWDNHDLIMLAAKQLESAVASRRRKLFQLHSNVRAMEVAYDPVERALDIAREGSRDSAARRFIIETAMRAKGEGTGIPNEREWTELVARSELCIESGIRGEGIRYDIAPGALIVESSFELRLEPSDSPVSSLREYRIAEASADMPQREIRADSADGDSEEETVEEGRDFLEAFPELTGLDAAVRNDLGFRIPTLMGVFGALSNWPTTLEDPAPEVSLAELESYCRDSQVPEPDDVPAAIDFLTLHSADLRAEDPEPWEMARRHARLVTRPLPEITPGMRVVMPWALEDSGMTYVRYLRQGRWPFPAASWPPEIRRAADAYRETRNRELEDRVEATLGGGGFTTQARIKPEDASRFGFTSLSGEIDVLAADLDYRILWAVEAKDPAEAFSVAEIERSVRRFTEEDGYLNRLSRKVADASRDVSSVLAKLGVSAASGWMVRGLMVTREPHPAAFAPGVTIPFATVGALLKDIAMLRRPGGEQFAGKQADQ